MLAEWTRCQTCTAKAWALYHPLDLLRSVRNVAGIVITKQMSRMGPSDNEVRCFHVACTEISILFHKLCVF